MDLLDGVPPMPRKGEAAQPDTAPTSADLAIATNLQAMQKAKEPPPAPRRVPDPPPRSGSPWWKGRTFYACACGARDERTSEHRDHPDTLPCWSEKCDGTMTQWTPPTVERERIRHG